MTTITLLVVTVHETKASHALKALSQRLLSNLLRFPLPYLPLGGASQVTALVAANVSVSKFLYCEIQTKKREG
jgi:hypothetical protein